MVTHIVRFEPDSRTVEVPTGTLIVEAAQKAGVEIGQPCGGQGRCGRCSVKILDGAVRRRSTLRLSQEDISSGYALACQSVIEQDITILTQAKETLERKLTSDRSVAEIKVPEWYFYEQSQTIKRFRLNIPPPSLDDQRDDLSRLRTAFRQQYGYSNLNISLPLIRKMGLILRESDWQVTLVIDLHFTSAQNDDLVDLVNILQGQIIDYDPLWAVAIDIGTTTVTIWIVDLTTGEVKAQLSEYNQQITRGEDVISRIIYAGKEKGGEELQNLVISTINHLINDACHQLADYGISPHDIIKATISANSTMVHLLLRMPANSIRLSPFITIANDFSTFSAREIGINICEDGIVDCLPGVASYVGSDITAGVYSSGMDDTPQITLFMDVGTNGEIVLGSREWLVSCACSAGPAFEGAGVLHGMRATKGAIEEVWINHLTYEPTYRVIGKSKPKGICGSGLISLLSEMFITGVIDKAGNLNAHLPTSRIREGTTSNEYVIAWGDETADGNEITITRVDIDNLIRAKGAIYAGYTVLAESVGVPMELIEQMLIGGSFGKYINVEKGINIGLLPDLPWDRFQFLGNTSVRGAYFALLDHSVRQRIQDIASRMTYIELSADNSFYEAFISALFLPHTDLSKFPSVVKLLEEKEIH